MKVAVTAQQSSLDSPVDPRFGRCAYFLVVETDDLSFEPVNNSNVSSSSGAGIQSAQLMAEKGVKFVFTGNCGPNAHQTLAAAGIEITVGASGTVREVINNFKKRPFPTASQPSVPGHFGLGAQNFGGSGGTVRGAGMKRGSGGGRGRGMGMGRGVAFDVSRPESSPAISPLPENECAILKNQAEALARQLNEIQDRIQMLEKKGQVRSAVVVTLELCTGCGACVEICPKNAIELKEGKAEVTECDCISCGACVDICPEKAISLP